jgi:hypothetical protein
LIAGPGAGKTRTLTYRVAHLLDSGLARPEEVLASPASELQAIEAILQADTSADEAATVKEIAAQTGISVQTARRRMRLRSLTAGLRAAFDEGRITVGVAERAARLPRAQQTCLERQLDEATRLTLADVRAVARSETNAARAALPGELFTDHDTPRRQPCADTSRPRARRCRKRGPPCCWRGSPRRSRRSTPRPRRVR